MTPASVRPRFAYMNPPRATNRPPVLVNDNATRRPSASFGTGTRVCRCTHAAIHRTHVAETRLFSRRF